MVQPLALLNQSSTPDLTPICWGNAMIYFELATDFDWIFQKPQVLHVCNSTVSSFSGRSKASRHSQHTSTRHNKHAERGCRLVSLDRDGLPAARNVERLTSNGHERCVHDLLLRMNSILYSSYKNTISVPDSVNDNDTPLSFLVVIRSPSSLPPFLPCRTHPTPSVQTIKRTLPSRTAP